MAYDLHGRNQWREDNKGIVLGIMLGDNRWGDLLTSLEEWLEIEHIETKRQAITGRKPTSKDKVEEWKQTKEYLTSSVGCCIVLEVLSGN